MREERKSVDLNHEAKYLDTSTAASMTSQRKHAPVKIESGSINGSINGDDHPGSNTSLMTRKKPGLITYNELPT